MASVSLQIKHGPGDLDLVYGFMRHEQVILEVFDPSTGLKGWERFWVRAMSWDKDRLELRLRHYFIEREPDRERRPIGSREELRKRNYYASRKTKWLTLDLIG